MDFGAEDMPRRRLWLGEVAGLSAKYGSHRNNHHMVSAGVMEHDSICGHCGRDLMIGAGAKLGHRRGAILCKTT